ncbi:hypothetical protein EAY27_20675 [Vibrio anguillarum]|nr:hypothetical protein [Vibrio anguillarum]MBF4279523.1 hypothetical protein [Vibrio anguillarum]MBF4301254.1 hypothetical protein [Vibrio anguillarum]MBF4336283.1 hypothetical protein [Vibrio anguillarum]MBF4364498.1 hypothetical protein [Vibrio anguillarum]
MKSSNITTPTLYINFYSFRRPHESHNARLSGEQRYHDTQLLQRKHTSQIKPKLPSVVNPS